MVNPVQIVQDLRPVSNERLGSLLKRGSCKASRCFRQSPTTGSPVRVPTADPPPDADVAPNGPRPHRASWDRSRLLPILLAYALVSAHTKCMIELGRAHAISTASPDAYCARWIDHDTWPVWSPDTEWVRLDGPAEVLVYYSPFERLGDTAPYVTSPRSAPSPTASSGSRTRAASSRSAGGCATRTLGRSHSST